MIRHPADVALLKEKIPELSAFSDEKVQRMYSIWSEDNWAAGWHTLTDEIIEEFRDYLPIADVMTGWRK